VDSRAPDLPYRGFDPIAALWNEDNLGGDQGSRAADVEERSANGDHAGNKNVSENFGDVALGINGGRGSQHLNCSYSIAGKDKGGIVQINVG